MKAVATRRVVKVGGSLLGWPPLAETLQRWLAAQAPLPTIMLAGGGPLADAIRDFDRRLHLGDEAAHWLCIDCLRVTARLLAELLHRAGGDAPLILGNDQLLAWCAQPTSASCVFDPYQFLCHEEPRWAGRALPHTWAATSDSIAARLASTLPDAELVLLKSVSSPATDAAAWSAAGIVDEWFAEAAQGLPSVRLVNLRAADEAFGIDRKTTNDHNREHFDRHLAEE